ncbi:MAG TPA: RHS repeat-associated core domain-containing protein, partial [Opitutales bacterium]|nr:RHS repeat-associated core domain-containing protein [Opitutales bacterium]
YVYDYRGRRVLNYQAAQIAATGQNGTSSATLTSEMFSGGVPVRDYAPSGNYTTYTPGNLSAWSPANTTLAPSVEFIRGSDQGGGVGGVIFSLHNDAPSLYHYDSRGDVIAQTDWNGNLTYQAGYLAFGQHNASGNMNGSLPMFPAAYGAEEWTGTNATTDNLRDNTKEENDLGLVNQGQRYTNLQTDMFLTRDPTGFADGTNPYIYVHQNPYGHFDPEGLWTEEDYQAKDMAANRAYHTQLSLLDSSASDYEAQVAVLSAQRASKLADDAAGIEAIEETAKELGVDAKTLDDRSDDYYNRKATHELAQIGNNVFAMANMVDGEGELAIGKDVLTAGTEKKVAKDAAEDAVKAASDDTVSVAATRGGASGAVESADIAASTPVGRLGAPLGTVTRNEPGAVDGIKYVDHAFDQMQARGLTPSVAKNAIEHGVPSPDPIPGRIRYFDSTNNITVVTEANGTVVTVMTGKR